MLVFVSARVVLFCVQGIDIILHAPLRVLPPCPRLRRFNICKRRGGGGRYLCVYSKSATSAVRSTIIHTVHSPQLFMSSQLCDAWVRIACSTAVYSRAPDCIACQCQSTFPRYHLERHSIHVHVHKLCKYTCTQISVEEKNVGRVERGSIYLLADVDVAGLLFVAQRPLFFSIDIVRCSSM